jgi:uncharacterized protein
VRNGKWVAQIENNKDPVFKSELAQSKGDPLEKLKSIYRVLLTRGMKGTFLFVLDNETRDFIRRHLIG